jgi:histone-lysine N-methyltransferase SETMAR
MIILPNRLIANGQNCLSMVEKSLDDDLCQATVFCDWQKNLMIDSLHKGSTVTGEYYANLMHRLRDSIKVKRCEKLTQDVLLLRDHASVHKSRLSKAAIAECDFVEIDHPPYSPDLIPFDYFSFPNLKKTLRGTKMRDDEELRAAVEWHFADKPNEYFYNGLKMLLKRCNTCIQKQKAYIQQYIFVAVLIFLFHA